MHLSTTQRCQGQRQQMSFREGFKHVEVEDLLDSSKLLHNLGATTFKKYNSHNQQMYSTFIT